MSNINHCLVYFFISTFLISGFVFSQNSAVGVITNIEIIGNEVTDSNVILRELLVKTGDIPDPELLDQSKKRLENLLLFNRVELTLLPSGDDHVLIVEVTERLYIFPFPIFSIHDRDWDKLSYGVSLAHLNFRGQNEQLKLAFWFGYQPGYTLSFSDQWAGDSLHLTTNFDIMKYTTSNKSLEFNENHFAIRAAVGKWWNYHFKTEFYLVYDQIKVASRFSDYLYSGNNSEKNITAGLFIRYDTRDLYAYPSTGWYNAVYISKNGLNQKFNNYWQLVLDTRRYISINKIILAARVNQNYQFGDVPIYRRNYIGFDERIRGRFFEVFEGRQIQTANLEMRFPLLPVQYNTYPLPGIPEMYTRDLKFGISGHIFADAGIIWNHAYQYNSNNLLTGFGTGIYIHLPYIEVFRIDFGLDTNLNGQFIFEIGTSL